MKDNLITVEDNTKVLGKIWKTPKDKEIWIRKTPQYGFFEIVMAGERPEQLLGNYTKPQDAEKAIEKYLVGKVEQDGVRSNTGWLFKQQ